MTLLLGNSTLTCTRQTESAWLKTEEFECIWCDGYLGNNCNAITPDALTFLNSSDHYFNSRDPPLLQNIEDPYNFPLTLWFLLYP